MKLNVACNWDFALPKRLSQFPEVRSLYGNTANRSIGGGRLAHAVKNVDKSTIEVYVQECHRYGIEFQYLLTSPGLAVGTDFLRWKRDVLAWIGWLREIKVDSIAVGNLFLLELCKMHYPDLPVKGSVFLRVDSVHAASYYEEKGLDSFVLPFDRNRDFPFLERLRRSTSLKIQLIANGTCLRYCPYGLAHALFLGYGSQSRTSAGERIYIDACLMHCRIMAMRNHDELVMSSNWIRPEDIHVYEEMGIEWFKITDRSSSSDVIARNVEAYTSRSYKGNIFDILTVKSPFDRPERFAEALAEPNLRLLLDTRLTPNQRLFMATTFFDDAFPSMDNRQLGDFLDSFRNEPCAERACGTGCHYCETVADGLLRFQDESCGLLEIMEGVLESFYRRTHADRS